MPTEACAPGRVELLGNHTDYNQGVVLAAAIDRRLKVSGERRSDGVITLRSVSLGKFEIRRENLRPQSEPRWVNYVLGVVRELLDAGLSIDGFRPKSKETCRRVADCPVPPRSKSRRLFSCSNSSTRPCHRSQSRSSASAQSIGSLGCDPDCSIRSRPFSAVRDMLFSSTRRAKKCASFAFLRGSH
jgi:hypothetical protein